MRAHSESRRDRILESAAEVFRENGFEGAAMSEIGRRAGGSKATLYSYFPSKEDLFVAVALAEGQRHLESAATDMVVNGERDLREALAQFGAAYVSFLCSDVACAAFRMVIAEAGRSEIGRLFYERGPKKGLDQLAEVLQAAVRRGELRQVDPWIAAQHLNALFTSEVQHRWYCREAPPVSDEEARSAAERAVNAFLCGYKP